MTDTSAEAVAKLLNGVTDGPWGVLNWSKKMLITGNIHQVANTEGYPSAFVPAWDTPAHGEVDGADESIANARFIAAARQLVPALSSDLTAALAREQALLERVTKLTDALRDCVAMLERANSKTGVCCCGGEVDTHSDPMHCGHLPVDMGEYYAGLAIARARAALSQEAGNE